MRDRLRVRAVEHTLKCAAEQGLTVAVIESVFQICYQSEGGT